VPQALTCCLVLLLVMNQVRPSPGPSWAHLQGASIEQYRPQYLTHFRLVPSTPSSAAPSVEGSDHEDMIFDDDLPTPTRKRKVDLGVPPGKRKRARLPRTNERAAFQHSTGGPSGVFGAFF
jgi:hypothetical protein